MRKFSYIFVFFALSIVCRNLHASYSVSEEWSSYVGGQYGNDTVLASAMDSNGRVYFGGYLGDGTVMNDDGVYPTTPPAYQGALDGFVAEVNSNGELQWYVALGSTSGGVDDEIRGIAEHNQSVYAVSWQEQAANQMPSDGVAYSLSKTDGSVNWSYLLGQSGATNAFNAVAVDTDGNIYAVGYTSIPQIDATPNVTGYNLGGPTYGHSLQGGLDACVVKISSAGSLIWVHYLGGVNYDSARSCTIGTNGYLYVGGETCSPGWVSSAGGVTPSSANMAGFLVKLSTDGDHVWSTYLGGSGVDSVSALAFENSSGKLFAAGSTRSSDYMNLRPRLNTHRGGSDGFVTSITDSGTAFSVNWSKFYGSAQNESISAMQQLNAGEMIVGGTTPNGSWLPDADNPYSGGSDGFIAVLLGSSGTNQWSTYTGGDGAETLNTVTARNGVFYAGGMTRSESWVSGGFHTVWDKDNIFGGAEEFGFLCKYQSSGYVPDLPLFTLQPQPVTVEEQQDAQFTVEFTGTEPMICQWLTNGVPVQGETGTSLTLSAVTLAQDGDLISCVVSNLAGATTSDNALLTVTAIPNGWITIGISPSGAVSAGAAWSIDSGSTWHADGEVINVITGSYAVTYKDGLFGWAAPATPNTTTVINGQTNSLAAVYSEVFYTNYREISGTNVTVYVDPSVDADFCYLTETLPAGLTPYDYAPFSWNSSTRKLTYFMPVPAPAQFSYSVTGAEGTYQVSGTVNFGVGGVATVGDNQIVISGPPPVVPVPDIIGFAPDGGTPGNFLLTFISIADQAYLIETNGTPAALGWAQQGQVSGEADQTTTSVPASGPALFYRVRTPAP